MSSLWMIAASLLFACMGVCVKLGAAKFPAGELVFYRGLIACLLLAIYVRSAGLSLATVHWRAHLARGFAGFASLVLYFYAIIEAPLATAVTLNYSSPLFLSLLVAFWLREPVRPAMFLTVAAGLVGVAMLLQPSLDSQQARGAIAGLASGVISSVAYLNVRRLGELGEPEWRTVFYFSLVTTLGGLPWALASLPLHGIDVEGAWLLAGVGSFGAAAQLCMTRAYKEGRTVVTASLAYSTVIFSSVFGVWLWNERLPPLAWLGIAVIVASGALTTVLARATPLVQD